MNSAQFLEILHKADSLDHRDIQQLQKVQENFPYFQIPYILTARYEYQQNVTENTYSLAYAAITSPDRIWLKSLIEKQKENTAPPEEDVIEKREKEEEKKLVDETKEPTTLFRSISKKEVKLESIKEIEAKQHTENLAAGNTEIKYNLSAATMRITIVIDVEYINTSNDEETLKRPLTFFKDYDPRTTTFSAMEKELVDEIFTIIQDIFTAPVDNSYFTYIQAKRNIHVNAAQFLEIIQKSDPLDRSEILQLQKVQENFPYFQIPHILTARYEFQKDSTVKTPALGYAAITSPDRMWLKVLIEKAEVKTTPAKTTTSEVEVKTEAKSEPIPETIPKEEATSEVPEVVKPKPRRRKPPKDDLIETIKRKEKRVIVGEKKIEQIDLIKAFSKKDIKLATIKEIEANQNTENLAAASTQINDKLMSESYAKILAKQGKKQIAKEIYEKLVLKFPDKRTYFADLIEKLKD